MHVPVAGMPANADFETPLWQYWHGMAYVPACTSCGNAIGCSGAADARPHPRTASRAAARAASGGARERATRDGGAAGRDALAEARNGLPGVDRAFTLVAERRSKGRPSPRRKPAAV
jgi:hypothetical protein